MPTPAGSSQQYVDVDTLKGQLAIGSTDTDDDLELNDACYAASRWIDEYTERFFYQTTSEARTFVPCDLYYLKLPEFCDLVSVDTFKTDSSGDGTFETTWLTSDYQLLPVNPSARAESRPYTAVKAVGSQTFPWIVPGIAARDDLVQITGVWGWPAVPYAVKQAARLIAAEMYRIKDAPLGVAGEGEFAIPINTTTQRAKSLLGPYRRNVVLVA